MAFASNKPLYLLHMDLCGPMRVQSINGKLYVLVVVDDYLRYTWVFFLHSKDEASEVIISFIKKTQVNLQLQVQRVRTDNGTKFKNKTLAKFFDEDVGKLKAKGDIGVFVGYSKESDAFRIYNKRTRKIHGSVNVNFDEISKMASKQFNLEPGLSNLNEREKYSNPSVSKVSKASKKDLEDLFQDFYDEYFDSSKIIESSTTNVETSINEEVFHEVSESFQGESSSSSLNDDVQQSPKEVILSQTNTQSISNNMIPNVDEATLTDADWVSAMQEELDRFGRLKRVSLVYELEPCYNQNFSDNAYTHDSPGVTPLIDHHCCYKCGDSLNNFFCHQCTCEFCGNDAHDGNNFPAQIPFIQTLASFPQQFPCCEDCGGPHKTFLCQPMNYFESNPCYDSNSLGFDQIEPPQYSVNPSLNIQNEPDAHELFISKLIQQKLQNEYAQPFPAIAITFDLPTVEPKDSLRMGDEHLDTILETESDESVKSNVDNRVPNPSDPKDLSDKIISMKIDPHHLNAESDLIKSLLNHYSLIISSPSKIDSLLDEFVGELILLNTIPPGIDEINCDPEEEIRLIEKLLYDNSSPRPLEEFVSKNSNAAIESFSSFPIPVKDSDSLMEEIDLSFTPDDPMPPGIEEDYDSERDMLIFEELLSNDSLSLPENESFHFNIPSSSRPPAKPPDDDSGILTVKMVGDISEHDVPLPKIFPTQPTLFSNQDKSPHLLSHRDFKASQLHSECPMTIYGGNTPILDVLFLYFYPP
nr:retrotransposon protein, putative, Ty1-copia subclass [Tanacetum cinerariifolium]